MRGAVLAPSVSGVSTTARTETGRGGVEGALSSWRDGPAKRAILEFVAATSGRDGSAPVAFLRSTQHPTLGRGYLDDGPEKPIRIWSRTGRRPLLAAGNTNGDIAMLEFTQHPDKPFLRLLVLHDDGEREFDGTRGAEQALERAGRDGWNTVSVRNDWATVF